MAEGDADEQPVLTLDPSPERQRDELAELAASRRDLVAAVTRQYDFHMKTFGLSPTEAESKTREFLEPDRFPLWQGADQVDWWEIERVLRMDPEQGQAMWQAVKDEARTELATGVRASRTVERPVRVRPYERAQFLVILDSLRAALEPRDALEVLLVQQMAAAYELHLRWQKLAVVRVEEDVWEGERDRRRSLENMSTRDRERYELDYGWLPPRLATADAIEQAVGIADRYQRTFLRLLKAFRDTRRLIGSLVVTGGQVNVGRNQINLAPTNPNDSDA